MPKYLEQAHRSLDRQTTPWEWLIQLDAEEEAAGVPGSVRDDPRARIDINRERLGIEPTRNLALLRARGRFLQNLDADDYLLEAGFDVTAAALQEAGEAFAFCVGDCLDLFEDGRTAPNRDNRALVPGRIDPGLLFDVWQSERFVPIHMAGLVWRTSVVRAYGGWQAVPGSGDTALLMAIAEDFPGLYVDVPTVVYRRHRGQTTETETFRDNQRRNWELARMRVRELRRRRRQEPGFLAP